MEKQFLNSHLSSSPEKLQQLRTQYPWISELLPGIEDFLCRVLAREELSGPAEELRLYFIERLDILKLPPSLPPRHSAGALDNIPVSPVKFSPVKEPSPPSPNRELPKSPSPKRDLVKSPSCPSNVVKDIIEDDFAAYQREISRALLAQNSDVITAEDDKEEDSEDEKGVKVYDDIDIDQILSETPEKTKRNADVIDETNLYEIPVLKRLPFQDENTDGKSDRDVLVDSTATEPSHVEKSDVMPPPPLPPPLPPRRERAVSDAQSRSSVGSILEDKPPDLPERPNLPSKSGILKHDSKSEKSLDTMDEMDNCDGTSYESYEEEYQQQDLDAMNKFNIKLPKPLKKSKRNQKTTKSRSSKEWDIALPFGCLEEVTLSGELQYKGKLSWTRKLVALTEGRMVCYKPDKADSKPAVVINLTGYDAKFAERDNHRGFDIRLMHPAMEMHHFLTDFKDWASMWCEYVNNMAQGKTPPGQYHHLARTSTFTGLAASHVYGSKTDIGHSVSNLSTCSSDNQEFDPSSLKRRKRMEASDSQLHLILREHSRKVSRMGSIAFRATQFFENIGKKPTTKKSSSFYSPSGMSLGDLKETRLSTCSDSLGFLPTPSSPSSSVPDTPVFLEAPQDAMSLTRSPVEKKMCHIDPRIKHQGYLHIYSSFNRRRWGQRWCVVRGSMLECYRNETSTVCELEVWLRNCFLRRATAETKSELGLMLEEKGVEKITIEPLNRSEMGRWLRTLMNESMTQQVPEGLEDVWEEEESPYHDIKTEDLNSSDGFNYKDPPEPPARPAHHYDLEDNDTLTTIDFNNSLSLNSPCSTGEENGEDESPHVRGNVTGELYTQVRKSSTGTMEEEMKEVNSVIKNNSLTKAEEGHFTFSSPRGANSPLGDTSVFGSSYQGDDGSGEGSMFADILTKINRHFSRENEQNDPDSTNQDHFRIESDHPSSENEQFTASSENTQDDIEQLLCENGLDEIVEDSDSDKNTDTAYNSGVNSENSSLERKNRGSDQGSLTHSQNDLDTMSQATDILVSPLEDSVTFPGCNDLVQIEVTSPDEDSNFQNMDQSDNGIALMDNSDTGDYPPIIQFLENDQSGWNGTENKKDFMNSKTSRDQCDSAIYEAEVDCEELPQVTLQKVEQLREHLVELKDKRISVRDQKNQMGTGSWERDSLEEEYLQLDHECKQVATQISVLEQQV
ncbi:uncharacterized protein LOC110462913 isoform X2 [Mizuhopecten yessoensis]|uniref:uncharacterized protein LOC110462913 isoform X2 n=1 Tax=Mizuhopecten yessoensis TaxID=6573 RepID=UPI000B45888A|nr:uncharacterized protein LOC110462913 isoform X2 [Mizuhopecten yessoensis]